MKPAELRSGNFYVDAERTVRRIDRLEPAHNKGPGVVQYTVIACAAWPKHVGKNYVCCPRWFAELAVKKVEPSPANL